MNTRALCLCLLATVAGCVRRAPLSSQSQDPAPLLQQLDEAERRVATLKADGKLTVKSPQGSGTLNVSIEAGAPGRVHLESYDFFNRPVAQLISDGSVFGLYQVTAATYYDGPATAANLRLFTQVPLGPEELVAILLGRAPRFARGHTTARTDGSGAVLVQEDGERRQTLKLDGRSGRVTELVREGTDGFQLTFEDERALGSFTFPRRMQLVAHGGQTSLDLRYQEPSVNVPLAAEEFKPAAPEGVHAVHLDARGR